MINDSELYPINNECRTSMVLDGMWKFSFDPEARGERENWPSGLPLSISMPVPASFSDFFTTAEERDYCGDFWYETEFYVPGGWEDKEVFVRFGSITHRAAVYCNGQLITEHEGGFLPVIVPVTGVAVSGQPNKLVVKVNNELNESSIPCGFTKTLKSGRKISRPYFDFYNYSGIQRSVWLMGIPKESIQDYSVSYELEGLGGNTGKDSPDGVSALVHYRVVTSGNSTVRVALSDQAGTTVAVAEGKEGILHVLNAHLWKVRNSYLYKIDIVIHDGETIIDHYSDRIGIRTVRIDGARILINEEPVYLKGYGKHEDFEVIGRGFNQAVMKRDFECMKWTGANCFRTSHYPYAEEWYRFADEEGFLIIDEVPAVGMMRSMNNFADAGTGRYTYFFETPTVPKLKAAHLQAVEEMIKRDKNHPCVFAWSLFNEPETTSTCSKEYFTDIFQAARELDPQSRPLTGCLEKNSGPDTCKCHTLCDFICLNRYYGWYIKGGPEFEEAMDEFVEEMEQWHAVRPDAPFVFTEFGTDTLAAEHKLPGVMWSQEYQIEYLEKYFELFDRYDFIQGELVWNFADFQTTEGIMRVNGNKKGIFTRNRQPKDAAFTLKARWESIQ